MNQKYWQLRAAGRNYYDAYRLVTKISNRLKALASRDETDEDLYKQLILAQEAKESSGKVLIRMYKAMAPEAVRKFQEDTPGLGEFWMARLVGECGDFRSYTEAWWENGSQAAFDSHTVDDNGSQSPSDSHSTPARRTLVIGDVLTQGVRELWAYCGHGDASLKRRAGMTQQEAFASGSPLAKMIVHEMAEFALRLNGEPDKNGRERAMCPYYPKYLEWKEQARAAHTDWSKGRINNHAVRKTGKAILKDLWRVQHGQPPVYGERTPWTRREAA